MGMHPSMAPHLQQFQAHLMRSAAGGLLSPLDPHSQAAAGLFSMPLHHLPSSGHSISKSEHLKLDSVVSSSVSAEADTSGGGGGGGGSRKPRIKREPSGNTAVSETSSKASPIDPCDLKDEPGDFIETNCHWRECGLEFATQDELVKVIIDPIRYSVLTVNTIEATLKV
jgi:transcriptional activator cubitus interruptus